jgi:C1A family cysteine protease
MLKKIFALCIAIMLIFPLNYVISADNEDLDEEIKGLGLIEMTEDERNAFNAVLPNIVNVRPNEIALSRLDEQSEITTFSMSVNDTEESEIESVQIGDEMVYSYPGEEPSGATNTDFPLPASVDVSQQLSFPPIGDQGIYNSCVSWSLAYYQLTNNTNVVRGLNAKSSVNSTTLITQNIMSPRWTYAHTNLGIDQGSYAYEACASIMAYGSPSCSNYSLGFTSSNLQQWSTDTSLWNSAIYNKPEQIAWGWINTNGIITGADDRVIKLKEILANGYVTTFTTYVNPYVTTKRTTSGASGLRYMSNMQNGNHAMTVVGYDDNFWVDINNNNSVNPGETGAFKVANSWGTGKSDFTNGYIWIPYDALGAQSGVNGVTTARDPAFNWGDYYYIQAKKSYNPLLIAEVQLTAAKRDQISLQFGISEPSASAPYSSLDTTDYYKIAFHNAGESDVAYYYTSLNRNFTGGTSETTATFAFDLTPLIKYRYRYSNGLSAKSDVKFYITATDTKSDSYSVKLQNVKIIEPITGNQVTATDTSTLSANGSSVTKTVNFQITPCLKTSPMQDISVTFTNQLSAGSITSSNFAVKDKNGAAVSGLTYSVINKNIMIYAPATGYDTDSKYEIQLGSTISSVGRNKLAASKNFLFYILGGYYSW